MLSVYTPNLFFRILSKRQKGGECWCGIFMPRHKFLFTSLFILFCLFLFNFIWDKIVDLVLYGNGIMIPYFVELKFELEGVESENQLWNKLTKSFFTCPISMEFVGPLLFILSSIQLTHVLLLCFQDSDHGFGVLKAGTSSTIYRVIWKKVQHTSKIAIWEI